MFLRKFDRFFAKALRQRRKEKKLSQEELAERAKLSSKMISLIERGVCNPSVNVADKVAQGLGVPFWRLVKDAETLRMQKETKAFSKKL